jgi:hypothetical protein
MRRTASNQAADDSADGAVGERTAHVFHEQVARPFGGGVFVTPDGAWLREGSSEFFVALGDPDPDYDAPVFAIKNLGFILVRVVAASRVDITLHPRNVAPAALSFLQQWLQSSQYNLFKLDYIKDRWISEVLTTPAQALRRLFEICALEMTEDANFLELPGTNKRAQASGFASLAH